MDLIKFFTLRYLFDTTLAPWQGFGEEVLYGSIALLILAIACKIAAGSMKSFPVRARLFNKFGTLCLTMGIVALVFWVTRDQYIPIFNMRFWWILWVLGFGVWAYFIVINIKKFAKNKEKSSVKQEVYTKYLPGKK